MKKLLFPILFHLSFLLYSQVETVVIQWGNDQGVPFFSHALYEDGENTLPYVVRKIPWKAEGMLPLVRIGVTASSPLVAELPAGMNTGHLKGSPLLEVALVKEANHSFVMVKVLPFQINSAGKVERIEAFEIQMEEQVALAPLKSSIKGEWATQSVLASGNWYRISVEKSGMHRLTYEQLAEMGLQNPASVRVYGSGARLLPESFSGGYIDDLQSLPIYMHKGSDGLFGPGDHILFYARGPVNWEYDQEESMFIHRLHLYSWKGSYFVTGDKGPAAAPEEVELSSGTLTHTVSDYDYLDYLEEETYNLINSGKEWYGDNFNVNLEENYAFALPDRVTGEALKVKVSEPG